MKGAKYEALRVQQPASANANVGQQMLDLAGRGLARRVTAAALVLLVLVLLIQVMMVGRGAREPPTDVVTAEAVRARAAARAAGGEEAPAEGTGHVHLCKSRWNYIEIKRGVDGVDYDMMMCFIRTCARAPHPAPHAPGAGRSLERLRQAD